ncbi:MAG: PIG-L family deacetylase [Chloroflexia bacterium]|nr:PIG-L family deacetylase [Chloroflexia bacterium]
MTATLLAIFPHPDDETFSAGGIMAAARDLGDNVILICATRGEAGESGDPNHDTPEALGQAREAELRAAMRALNVGDVRFLGYRDSGMEGSAEAQNPHAFVQAPVADASARLAPMIRDIRPDTIVTFGEDGVYGHPDHIHLHHVVKQAVLDAGEDHLSNASSPTPWRTPYLYFATAPREDLEELLARPRSPLASISERARANLGTPRSQITTSIDVTRWARQKQDAFRAHHSQTGEGGPLSGAAPATLERRLISEHFVRAALPWQADGVDIVAQVASDVATRQA